MRLIHGEYCEAVAYCRKMIKSDFFEFDFPFVPMSENFREIDRFLWESRHQCTRFRNRYDGPAVIDITDWNSQHPNDYFDAFLYFLKNSEKSITCTFISSEPFSQAVLDRISRLFKVKEISLGKDSRPARKNRTIGFASETTDKEEK